MICRHSGRAFRGYLRRAARLTGHVCGWSTSRVDCSPGRSAPCARRSRRRRSGRTFQRYLRRAARLPGRVAQRQEDRTCPEHPVFAVPAIGLRLRHCPSARLANNRSWLWPHALAKGAKSGQSVSIRDREGIKEGSCVARLDLASAMPVIQHGRREAVGH